MRSRCQFMLWRVETCAGSKRFRVELFVCRWRLEADGTLKLVNDGQCLSTASSISHNGDTMGYSVVLQPCVSSVSWVQEASTPVVYPSLDDEFLACQSPHYLVSVKQGPNTHQCFVYFAGWQRLLCVFNVLPQLQFEFFFGVCEFKSLQLPCWSRSHRADLRGVRDSATCTGVHVRRGQRCLAMLNLGVGGYCADWSLPCPCGQALEVERTFHRV